jgi:large subunit ribosomal protein L43
MCTKGVWQLKTLVVRYCPIGGSSAGTREYLRTGLVDFAKQNSQVECKAILGKGKHPVMEGRYVWGVNKVCDLRNKSPKQIEKLVDLLRNTSGHKVTLFKTPVVSQRPSIQGRWQPNITSNISFNIKA